MCLINHTHRFIFIHIPKNAGTAVATALSPLTTWRDLELGATALGQAVAPHFRRRFGISKHSQLRDLLALLGEDDLARYRTFAVARHPVERVTSTFRFLRRWTDWQSLPEWADHAAGFRQLESAEEFVRSSFFATPGPDRILMPQVEWVTRQSGAPIAIDHLLHVETLAEDMGRLLKTLRIPDALVPLVRLDRLNAAPDDDATHRLSSSALALIAQRYAADFALLGYDPHRQ